MKTAKIFIHEHSQAVRLPKEFRFPVNEVYIEKSGQCHSDAEEAGPLAECPCSRREVQGHAGSHPTRSVRPPGLAGVSYRLDTDFQIVPFDERAAKICGVLRAALEKKGGPIGPMDILIAAHAVSTGATLITHNTR